MKILHLCAGNMYGGVERLLTTLATYEGVAGISHQFAICFPGRLQDELSRTGTRVHRLGEVRFSRPLTVWRARRRLRAILKDSRIDVVVTHSSWPHAVGAPEVRRAELPLVFWAHGPLAGRHWLERLAKRQRPNMVLANSEFTLQTVGAIFPNVPVVNQRLPVAPPRRTETDRSALRSLLLADDEAVVIVIACRMEAWKGHRLLLAALSQMRDVPRWQCWVVGGHQRKSEEKYFAELRANAQEGKIADRIQFLGQRNDVSEILAAADVHCQPNEGPEPFGLTFVEALYAGLPVVTTRMGGAVETVDDSCGILVPPGDVAGLANALQTLVESSELRARLGKAGLVRASQIGSPEVNLQSLRHALSKTIQA